VGCNVVTYVVSVTKWHGDTFNTNALGVVILARLFYLSWILFLLNLLPGFPLDGGRVFRSMVWGISGNLRRANSR